MSMLWQKCRMTPWDENAL